MEREEEEYGIPLFWEKDSLEFVCAYVPSFDDDFVVHFPKAAIMVNCFISLNSKKDMFLKMRNDIRIILCVCFFHNKMSVYL